MRNIAVVPILSSKVVQTTKYSEYKYIGEPSNIIKQLSDMGADEIFVVNITGRRYQYHIGQTDLRFLEKIAKDAFCPLGYGGNLKREEDVDLAVEILKRGYEKIISSTNWMKHQRFYKDLSDRVGQQSVVKCVELSSDDILSNKYHRAEYAITHADCGEIMLVDILRNGTLNGFNPRLCELARKSPVPISVCGGYNGEPSDIDTAASTYYMLYKGQVMLNYERHNNTTL